MFFFFFSQKVKPFIVSSDSEITLQTNRKSSEGYRIKDPLELLLLQKILNVIWSDHWRKTVTERCGWKSKILSESSIRSQSVTIELSRLRPNFKVFFLPCLSIIKLKKYNIGKWSQLLNKVLILYFNFMIRTADSAHE